MHKRFFLLALIAPAAGFAQTAVEYAVSFDNAVHHEARISVEWRDLAQEPLQVRMSRSSPGRYAIHEFGKNVYALEASDGAGKPLALVRSAPEQWDIAGHDGTVKFSYTLYADFIDGTYAAIDLSHAHLNMPATFVWARGQEQHPVNITFMPADPAWQVATQLFPTDDPFTFSAPDLQYFMDSPAELSAFSERHWQVEAAGVSQEFRLVVHHQGNEDDVDELLKQARKVVDQHVAIFGELPAFDNGVYTFLADFLPYADDDGMEHRNSTVLTTVKGLHEGNYQPHVAILSHELFHAWNAERLRPAELEPFDFERANLTPSLWFMEGFTQYYGNLVLVRAGLRSLADYTTILSTQFNNVLNTPALQFGSPQQMSLRAPYVDAAVANDPTNYANIHLSYYVYGSALGLGLDLLLRTEFSGLTLDSYMRLMWQRFGRTAIPYTDADLQATLAELTGDEDFAETFFSRYIHDSELPDYATLLDAAGLVLQTAQPDSASLGPVSLEFEGTVARIAANTRIASPLYVAGLDRGDEILALDRLDIRSQQEWDAALKRYAPGDRAVLRYRQHGVEKKAEVMFVGDPRLEVISIEESGKEPSAEQLAFRLAWLGVDK